MDSAIGWLLDFAIDRNAVTLWVKTIEGNILRLTDKYHPCFYILPKNGVAGDELFQILSQQPKIRVEWQNKLTDIFDQDGYGRRKLLCVYLESIYHYKTLLDRLQKDSRVARVFNSELSHVQQYLFAQLKVEPTCKIQVQYDNARLISMTKLDESDIEPPPFSILYFEVIMSLSPCSLDPYDVNDHIRQISARYQEEPEVIFEGSEEKMLTDFCRYVLTKDPDIMISPKQRSASVLNYVFARMSEYEIDIELGRGKTTMEDNWGKSKSIEGRIYLESGAQSVVEVVEKCLFACLPLGLAASYGMSRLVDSRNCYELINRGFAISRSDRQESIRTVEEIFARDKAGMIFSPRVGLHENVAVLDYEDEYANLILKYNLSYEMAPQDSKGLLPAVVDSVLKRRIMFKTLQKSYVMNSKEWLWCEERIVTLKNILVSLYGTTGSFWNRFANVDTFEEINRLSREILMKTKDIVQGLGYELLYADTDSVFLKKNGVTLEDFKCVKDMLVKETDIPMSVETCYKFLVLLPLEADNKIEALKHYYGITYANELVVRGIEIRRHDAPNFIKEFQTELLCTLFDCKDSTEVMSKGYENALLLVTKTIDKVMTGELEVKDLIVSKILGQDLFKYRSLFPHVSAALQLSEAGVPLVRGDTVQYIYTDAGHTNPLRRVTPLEFIGQAKEQVYDKEIYRDMLLEAAETVLGYFGFDRTLYGDTRRSKNKKWWHALRQERTKDIETERGILRKHSQ
jgi:DNA polymerase elongation subunit (family B)